MSRHLSRRGFSLIEVLIALAIFAIGSLAALALTGAIFDTAKDAQTITEETNVGRAEVERIMGQNASSVPAITDCAGTSAPASFLTCKSNQDCCRIVSVFTTGQSMAFQVNNYRQVINNAVVIEVDVRYPRQRDKRALVPGANGFVDCLASPTLCHNIPFFDEKPNQ